MIKTGFKFINELNCLNSGDLISIQGKCVQPEQFVISLMQNILDHNDGYVLLMNRYDFYLFTSVIFDNNSEDDKVLISDRISKNNILSKNGLTTDAEVLQRSLSAWLGMDKFKHLQDKKLLAIVTPIYKLRYDVTEEEATLVLKDAAQMLNIPVICWQKDSSDILLAADMTFKLSAVNGYKEPIDIEAVNPSGNTVLQIQANTSSLKYTEHLKECQKLWFYEEKDNEQ
ncbi:hypothetical protein IJ750_00700 [bacterium]|nr:hypothetical protein [bacterium]